MNQSGTGANVSPGVAENYLVPAQNEGMENRLQSRPASLPFNLSGMRPVCRFGLTPYPPTLLGQKSLA